MPIYNPSPNPTRLPSTNDHNIPSMINGMPSSISNKPPGSGGVPSNAVLVSDLSPVFLNDGITYVVLST